MSKPVLFASFRPLERAENISAIYHAYSGSKVHMCTDDPTYKTEVTSGKYDLLVTDDFPDVTPGKCIMIWHAIQGGKTIGLDQPNNPYYPREWADNITYIISASHDMIPVWSQCTGVPANRILALGMPRTDYYMGKHKSDGGTRLSNKRSYLFAPTFRDEGETPSPVIDWDYIDRELTDDEVLAVKMHPWYYFQQKRTDTGTKRYRHIIEIPGSEPSSQYLYDADVIITDYSSIMFDAYLLDKPVVLFEKWKGYTTTRGMYLQYPTDYCSRYATNEENLIDLLRTSYSLRSADLDCLHTVADMCDGHSCERLCNLITQLNGGEIT